MPLWKESHLEAGAAVGSSRAAALGAAVRTTAGGDPAGTWAARGGRPGNPGPEGPAIHQHNIVYFLLQHSQGEQCYLQCLIAQSTAHSQVNLKHITTKKSRNVFISASEARETISFHNEGRIKSCQIYDDSCIDNRMMGTDCEW